MNKYFNTSGKYGPYITIALVVLALWFVVNFLSKILIRLGLKDDPGEAAIKEQAQKGQAQVISGAGKAVDQQYKNQAPTKSDFEWLQIADQIHADLKLAALPNAEDAGYQVARVQNDSDVYKLIQAFGIRPAYVFFDWVPFGHQNLSQFIHKLFKESRIDAVNDNYRRKGIKFRW